MPNPLSPPKELIKISISQFIESSGSFASIAAINLSCGIESKNLEKSICKYILDFHILDNIFLNVFQAFFVKKEIPFLCKLAPLSYIKDF